MAEKTGGGGGGAAGQAKEAGNAKALQAWVWTWNAEEDGTLPGILVEVLGFLVKPNFSNSNKKAREPCTQATKP